MIEIISPAGFEHFFREVAEMIAAGTPDAEQGAKLAARYGLHFGDPDWMLDIIERYRLTSVEPPRGAAEGR